MKRFVQDDFMFSKLFKRFEIVDSKIKDGYVEYRYIGFRGRAKWVKRCELVWMCYKKGMRKSGHQLHHKDLNKLNDKPSNIVQLSKREHIAYHGTMYSKDSTCGSKRMYGRNHKQSTIKQMSESMKGNTNLPTTRNEEWKKRIGASKYRLNMYNTDKDKIMRKIIYMFGKELKPYKQIALELGKSIHTVHKRIVWFIEDNFEEKFDFGGLQQKLINETNFNKYRYYDEEYKVDINREVVRLRYQYLKTPRFVCDKLNIELIQFDNIIERFLTSNELKYKHNIQIYGLIVEKGLDSFKIT